MYSLNMLQTDIKWYYYTARMVYFHECLDFLSRILQYSPTPKDLVLGPLPSFLLYPAAQDRRQDK